MNHLRQILLRPIRDNERTRRYQEVIDRYIERLKAGWDLDRGLFGSKGIDLPHETVEAYWEMPADERAKITSEQARRVYDSSAGRDGTHWLAVAAFAWHSPLSRFRHDPELLRFFENGLRFYTSAIRDDGVLAIYGLNGLEWAHGWDIEGVIYGLVFLWDALNPEIRDHALERLRLSARRFAGMGPSGTHGNQGSVQALGLFLYGHLLDMPEALQASDQRWSGLVEKVLDDSGQVIEQYGPCMHYSYTCFIYAWLNAFLRGGDGQDARIEKCLHWFRYRHTDGLYPFPGPSSRCYTEKLNESAVDILAACEQMSCRNPMFQRFADKIWDRIRGAGGGGHGASPLLWAILACPGDLKPTPEQEAAWDRPFDQYYEWIKLLGRSPEKYVLVKRRYQTAFNVRDFLPFSGVQTWAWGNEPPIVHPTRLAPSTTQAWGLDTARQGVSYNWGLFGAGAMCPDFKFVLATEPGRPSSALARYDRLWRYVIFTDVSTVLLEWGGHGPRKTLWTLNRLEPAEPAISDTVVTFENRTARLYSTAGRPVLRTFDPGDGTGSVRVLEYDCGDGPDAFAFCNDSLRFGAERPLADRTLVFSDSTGRYRIIFPDRLVSAENPGNCSISAGELFWQTKVEQTAG